MNTDDKGRACSAGQNMNSRQLTKSEIRKSKLSGDLFRDQRRNPIYLILDNLKDMKNVGAILRLADAVLVEKVFICGNPSVLPPNRKITASSGGTENWVDWEYQERTLDVIAAMKQKKIQVTALEICNSSIPYYKASYSFPIALVFGREDDGISPEVLENSDIIIHLPILGIGNSLNVATTAGVILYYLLERNIETG